MSARVFLVEDLRPMHTLMRDLLAEAGGFEVVGIASTEAEARYWLSEHRSGWDVLVVDLVLEQGSGMEVVRYARSNGGGKIVVFSGYATPGIRANCLALGADEVFDKADIGQFMHWLRSVRQADRPSA